MVVSASLGLAGCASIDQLKSSVSGWFANDKFLGGHEEVVLEGVPDATDNIRPPKMLRQDATRASNNKDQPPRKVQQPQSGELPNKPPISVPAQAVTPPGAAAQPTPSDPAQLHTPWPEAPGSGTFSR
jgi:hypothetical protein